jgi:hypothetical protein
METVIFYLTMSHPDTIKIETFFKGDLTLHNAKKIGVFVIYHWGTINQVCGSLEPIPQRCMHKVILKDNGTGDFIEVLTYEFFQMKKALKKKDGNFYSLEGLELEKSEGLRLLGLVRRKGVKIN